MHWLETLLDDGPLAVYAEHIEDILIEYPNRLVFIQVKTRSASARNWTCDSMCADGGGIHSLGRAYAVAREVPCTFELHLEGPVSPSKPTADFITACTNADTKLRATIQKLLTEAMERDATYAELEDFLSRLTVRTNIPGQQSIDDRCIILLGGLAPDITVAAVCHIFGQLVQTVENAQDATGTFQPGTSSGTAFLQAQLRHLLHDAPSREVDIACKRLSREDLLSVFPFTRTPHAFLLIERSLADEPMTALEEKLRAAGASDWVVRRARELRAMSETRRFELLGGPVSRIPLLDDLCTRVLLHAESRAQLCKTRGESVNDLFAHLASESGIEDSDQSALFNSDRVALLGLLCCLSDECRFGWRAP